MQLRCVFWQLRCGYFLQLRCGYFGRFWVIYEKERGCIKKRYTLFCGYLIAVGLVYYDFIYEDECFAVLGVDSDVAGLAVAG